MVLINLTVLLNYISPLVAEEFEYYTLLEMLNL